MYIFKVSENQILFHCIIHRVITVEAGTIRLVYCPTNDMTADTLTKALPSVKVKHFASALGLCTV